MRTWERWLRFPEARAAVDIVLQGCLRNSCARDWPFIVTSAGQLAAYDFICYIDEGCVYIVQGLE